MKNLLFFISLLSFLQVECTTQKTIRIQFNINQQSNDSSLESFGYFDPNQDNEVAKNLTTYRKHIDQFWNTFPNLPKSLTIDIIINTDPNLETTLPESYGYFSEEETTNIKKEHLQEIQRLRAALLRAWKTVTIKAICNENATTDSVYE